MRVLLINVPIRLNAPPVAFPVGLGIIAQVLLDKGHDVEVLDINALRLQPDQVVKTIAKCHADVIGISGLISTYKYQIWLIEELKKCLPNATVVSGGGCATSVPHLMMENSSADILVIGEGENTISELVNALGNNIPLEEISGIVFKNNNKIITTEPRQLEKDLDNFPMPAYGLFPTEIYQNVALWRDFKNSLNIISSRGCPMDCNFCYALFGKRSYRRRGAQAIIKEIRFLKSNYDVEFIGFVDDNLTINRNHLTQVCKALEKEDIAWGCHGRIDTADEERLELMAKAGCKWLGFGIESGSQRILDAMNKRVTVEQARNAIITTRAVGIYANTTFIYGYPGEDKRSVAETMQFKLDLDIMPGAFYATPYPGTKLYEYAQEKNLIKNEHEYVLSLNDASDFTVNLTEFSNEDFFNVEKSANSELKIALIFKNFKIPPDNAANYLNIADDFLNREELIFPKAKGYVLMALSRYFQDINNKDMAEQTKQVARSYGVLC